MSEWHNTSQKHVPRKAPCRKGRTHLRSMCRGRPHIRRVDHICASWKHLARKEEKKKGRKKKGKKRKTEKRERKKKKRNKRQGVLK